MSRRAPALSTRMLREPVWGPVRPRSWRFTCTGRRATWTRSTDSPSRMACSFWRTRHRRTAPSTGDAARVRSGRRPRSRSTQARTWAHSGMGAPFARMTMCSRPGCEHLGQRAKGEHVELGYNERLDALQAALLRVKLPYLDGWNESRRKHAECYGELLPAELRTLEERPESPCIFHLYPVRVHDRDAVAARLGRQAIETGVHYAPAVHGHPMGTGRSIRHGELPQAEAWAAEELSLPMHPDLQPEEIERVASAVHSVVSAAIA